jgi:hypothetical protein
LPVLPFTTISKLAREAVDAAGGSVTIGACKD